MKIFYHCDDDGRCAAAIVSRELVSVFEMTTKDDFIKYNHDGKLDIPDFRENEAVYIVDLSLSDKIFEVIKKAVESNAKVVHIDHHKSTFEFMKTATPEMQLYLSKITKFYVDGLSGAMLTWVYSLMNEDERKDPKNVNYDFTAGFTHIAFYPETPEMREYNIPDVVRYIDDHDVWRHDIEESRYFHIAFKMNSSKNPFDDVWNNLIYSSNQRETAAIVAKGKTLWDYQTAIDKANMINAFEYNLFGNKCLCLNSPHGNSDIFGDKFSEYPMVCKFGYDGSVGKWRYTFYSSEKCNCWVDVSTIAAKFGGGGHAHAAGCVTDYLIFDGIDNFDHM